MQARAQHNPERVRNWDSGRHKNIGLVLSMVLGQRLGYGSRGEKKNREEGVCTFSGPEHF